jgi:hypothetical protein
MCVKYLFSLCKSKVMNIVLDQETKLFSFALSWMLTILLMKLSNIVEQTGNVDVVCFIGEMHFTYKHVHVWYIMVPTFHTCLSVHSSNH